MTTSSPGSKRAIARLKRTCFAPTLTHTFLGSGFHPRIPSVAAQIASLRAGMPVTAVYFDAPASMAFLAASSTACGGSKSGSPAAQAKTSMPRDRISMARAAMASVALGATALRREARERATASLVASIGGPYTAQSGRFQQDSARNMLETIAVGHAGGARGRRGAGRAARVARAQGGKARRREGEKVSGVGRPTSRWLRASSKPTLPIFLPSPQPPAQSTTPSRAPDGVAPVSPGAPVESTTYV